MKLIVDGKELEMSVIRAAHGWNASAMSLDENDMFTLARMPDNQLVAYVRQIAARVHRLNRVSLADKEGYGTNSNPARGEGDHVHGLPPVRDGDPK